MVTNKTPPGVDPLHSLPPTAAAPQALATSPPSKRDLTSWWRQFKRNTRKEEPKEKPQGIFGVPLNVSIKYANVAISLTNDNGESFIYGYVPIVIAKCGVFLKEKATDVEGIFRLNGSAKRIKDLQEIFDSPERYGKGLDWTGYTVHDAANVLRRYLNQLPEPIVPLGFYERFRQPLRAYQQHIQENGPATESDNVDHAKAVAAYQELIRELPPLNKQLLLYILDLLAVFASKSEQNRMTSGNLSAIFQPGLLSHPQHDMSPDEYKLSQDVLIFLIENQDHFLFGMNGTAADEQTMKEVEGGLVRGPTTHSGVRRSVSNASGGSFRKYESLRRNVSVSSRNSRTSNQSPSPATPTSLGPAAVHRSNTLPSKMAPAIPPSRIGRVVENTGTDSPEPTSAQHSRSPSQTPPATVQETPEPPKPQDVTESGTGLVYIHSATHGPMRKAPDPTPEKPHERPGNLQENIQESSDEKPPDMLSPPTSPPAAATPTRERKLSALFSKSPPSDREPRQPNRLKKRRIPGSASESAQSSSQSLQAATSDVALASQTSRVSDPPDAGGTTPRQPTTIDERGEDKSEKPSQSEGQPTTDASLRPYGSRTPSMNSRTSFTDYSDMDPTDDTSRERKENRPSWRFPRSAKRSSEQVGLGLGSPPLIASNPGAEHSTSSFGSWHHSSRSSPTDMQQFANDPSYQPLSLDAEVHSSSKEAPEPERRSLFGKFKAKVAQVRDGGKDSDRDRTRSPQSDLGKSQTLSPVGKDRIRPASIDVNNPSEGVSPVSSSGMPPAIPEEPRTPEKLTAASDAPGPAVRETTPPVETAPAAPAPPQAPVPAAATTGPVEVPPTEGVRPASPTSKPTGTPSVPLPTAESHKDKRDETTYEFLGN
ncbi:putative Rho GTPase activator (Sac7) [Aspergillus candidus]|uniref:RhoGAP-domain-containing protein n=1 Tax=Aspergillus candidus TaxID=41067 RepID=A0A2I2FPL1_ASPCN|nr:RhoGAP-domain-containing protein [Aspergillus candidus]PLB42565.1 RhoGAP-domain-containing protein [Aspergillus candidus]